MSVTSRDDGTAVSGRGERVASQHEGRPNQRSQLRTMLRPSTVLSALGLCPQVRFFCIVVLLLSPIRRCGQKHGRIVTSLGHIRLLPQLLWRRQIICSMRRKAQGQKKFTETCNCTR